MIHVIGKKKGNGMASVSSESWKLNFNWVVRQGDGGNEPCGYLGKDLRQRELVKKP